MSDDCRKAFEEWRDINSGVSRDWPWDAWQAAWNRRGGVDLSGAERELRERIKNSYALAVELNSGNNRGATDVLINIVMSYLPTLQPKPVEVGDAVVHLVRFLANYQRELCDIRAKAMRMIHLGDAEGARELLTMKWPIVQGSQNQWDLETIGKQPFEMAKMRPAIKALLDGSALRTQPQAPTDDTKELLSRGWKWLNDHANGDVCSDRSCVRCKVADAMFAIEKRFPDSVVTQLQAPVCVNCGETVSEHSELMHCKSKGQTSSCWATTQYQPQATLSGYGYGGSHVDTVWSDRPQAQVVEVLSWDWVNRAVSLLGSIDCETHYLKEWMYEEIHALLQSKGRQ